MREGVLSVWYTTDNGYFVQVLGTNVFIIQRQLDSGGTEPMEGAVKVGKSGEYFGKVGRGQDNGREVLCGGGASGASIWVQNMGTDSPVGEIPRWFPTPDGAADVRHGTQTSTGWDMSIYTHWGGARNGGDGGDRGVYRLPL